MILLNHVIQVLVGPDERLSGQYAFGLQFGDSLLLTFLLCLQQSTCGRRPSDRYGKLPLWNERLTPVM